MISKKELLEICGISYGQLYRWKREGLIPEEWFVKKSSHTGQETYFPKDKIMDRITTIQRLKDQYSLEELAKIIAPEVNDDLEIDMQYIQDMKEIDMDVVELYKKYSDTQDLKYFDFVLALAFSKMKEKLNESKDVFKDFIKEHALRLKQFGNIQQYIVVVKMDDKYYMMLFLESMLREMKKEDVKALLDPKMKVVCELSLTELNDTFRKVNKHIF